VSGSAKSGSAAAGRSGSSLGARVAPSLAHKVESGAVASLESYARIAAALSLRPRLPMADAHGHPSPPGRREGDDFVHAAMGEAWARALAGLRPTIAIDEPYQHYQFAGRADILAWDEANLLHIENRTRFPNLRDAAGAYNAKRRYLAASLGDRLGMGPRGWRSVTHVMARLWSSEVLHVLRLRRATFAALCPDPPDPLLTWLRGAAPPPGVASLLVVQDPAVPFGSRSRSIAVASDLARLRARYRGYADAAERLRGAGPHDCRRPRSRRP
jgi:hypothetical protein